jgi:hypothetical protein
MADVEFSNTSFTLWPLKKQREMARFLHAASCYRAAQTRKVNLSYFRTIHQKHF